MVTDRAPLMLRNAPGSLHRRGLDYFARETHVAVRAPHAEHTYVDVKVMQVLNLIMT